MRPLIPGLLLVSPLLGACGGTETWRDNRANLDFAVGAQRDAARRPQVVRRLNRVLTDGPGDSSEIALQRYFAAFLLARVHASASLSEPFLTEETTTQSRVGGIGQPADEPPGARRPSRVAHLVASIYHASCAGDVFPEAVRAAPEYEGVRLVPEELETLGLDKADVTLQVLITVAYARLGFRDEVAEILARSPDLLQLESCLAFLESHDIPPELRPWVCELVFHHLRSTNELEAYRFGVVAVEGRERFGYLLPAAVVTRIEDWIQNGASVLFACPESFTAYLPGQRRSPISGIPHIEYVAVERP